jgi:chemotaxis protein CheX
MDAVLIDNFIDATQNVFGTMLRSTVSFGTPGPSGSVPSSADVSSIIGFSGDFAGAAVVRLPMETALGIVESLCGGTFGADSDDFADAIGELANMICGGAKSSLAGSSISISCPQVVIGMDHRVRTPSDAVSITIPCTSPQGTFSIEVSIRAGVAVSNAASRTRRVSAG